MKTKTVRYVFADLPRDYSSLVAIFPPRTIHDKVDLANTMELIDALAGHKLSDDQDDYLETLAELVNAYDEANNPLADEDLTPVEVLEFLLEQHSMNASDLGKLLGDRAVGSKILRGEREISKAHARILAGRFKVSPGGVFVNTYRFSLEIPEPGKLAGGFVYVDAVRQVDCNVRAIEFKDKAPEEFVELVLDELVNICQKQA